MNLVRKVNGIIVLLVPEVYWWVEKLNCMQEVPNLEHLALFYIFFLPAKCAYGHKQKHSNYFSNAIVYWHLHQIHNPG